MKIVDLQKLWNYVVDNFLFETILSCKTTFESLKFEIQNFQTTLNGKTS